MNALRGKTAVVGIGKTRGYKLRGTSANQVPDAKLSLSTGGPTDYFVSTTLLGTAETLQRRLIAYDVRFVHGIRPHLLSHL
jgi:hypothetical protein